MSVKITVHGMEQNGVCSLSGKEGEVLTVTFDDGTVSERPLSQKAVMQLLRMKLAQSGNGKAPLVVPVESES